MNGRVLDLGSGDCWFKNKTLYLLLSTGLTYEVRKTSRYDRKLLTGMLSINTNKPSIYNDCKVRFYVNR